MTRIEILKIELNELNKQLDELNKQLDRVLEDMAEIKAEIAEKEDYQSLEDRDIINIDY